MKKCHKSLLQDDYSWTSYIKGLIMGTNSLQTFYCMSKKSCPLLYCEYTLKIEQDFLDIQYLNSGCLLVGWDPLPSSVHYEQPWHHIKIFPSGLLIEFFYSPQL